MVKNLPASFDPWVGKIPRRREWLPNPVFLPRESHGQRGVWWSVVHGVKMSWDMTEWPFIPLVDMKKHLGHLELGNKYWHSIWFFFCHYHTMEKDICSSSLIYISCFCVICFPLDIAQWAQINTKIESHFKIILILENSWGCHVILFLFLFSHWRVDRVEFQRHSMMTFFRKIQGVMTLRFNTPRKLQVCRLSITWGSGDSWKVNKILFFWHDLSLLFSFLRNSTYFCTVFFIVFIFALRNHKENTVRWQ